VDECKVLLSGAELKSQMEAEFGVELPETVVFDCRAPRIMRIGRFLYITSRTER
jgi:hypothetical protein